VCDPPAASRHTAYWQNTAPARRDVAAEEIANFFSEKIKKPHFFGALASQTTHREG